MTSRSLGSTRRCGKSLPSLLPRPPLVQGVLTGVSFAAGYGIGVLSLENVPAATTGYRFANVINGLMIDGAAKTRLDRVWRSFVGEEAVDFDTLAWHCRHVVMDGTLAGELTVLSASLLRLAREDRRTRDFTLNSLRQALAEVVASFPVYRTYMLHKPSAQDRKFVDWAIGRARRRSLAAAPGVFDFLRRVLIGRPLIEAPDQPEAVAGYLLAEAARARLAALRPLRPPPLAPAIDRSRPLPPGNAGACRVRPCGKGPLVEKAS